MPKDESTMKWKVDIGQLKASMQDAKRSISLANAEFKSATAGMGKWADSITGIEAKLKQLNSVLPQQKTILAQLEQQYKITAEQMGEGSAEAQKLKIQIENQKGAIAKTEASIGKYGDQLSKLEAEERAATTPMNQLNKAIGDQESQLASLKDEYSNAVLMYGENSKEAKALASQIESLSGELADSKSKQEEASRAADKLDKSIGDVGDEAADTEGNIGGLNEGFSVLKGTMAELAAQGVTALLDGLKQIGSALVDMGKQAIASYADYEQLVGGVETLFGAGGMTIEEYAKSVGKTVDSVRDEYDKLMTAQTDVMDNASNAFKTAGLSQNEYMDTVTGFSASLISSLEGDTVKAAAVADQAITDMSDNANKMGSDMSSVMSAYAGFAKGQYTLLDNLKLGYGGTKTEMERLIDDANKLKEAQGGMADLTIDSYADIIEAIHLVQDNMGITGTTAREAATTISGSLGMTKSAWQNLLTGMADDSADFDGLIDNLIESVLAFGSNIIPRIKSTINGMGKLISGLVKELVPKILDEIPPMITESVPILLSAAQDVISAVVSALPAVVDAISGILPEVLQRIMTDLPTFVEAGIQVITALVDGASSMIPVLMEMIPTLIMGIVTVISDNLPTVLETGVALITAIIDGLSETLPMLVEMLPTIIDTIVQVITENLPMILQSGVTILLSVINGLVNALPQLIQYVPTIIDTIVEVITKNLPFIIRSGIQVLIMLIKGLSQAIPQLISYVPEIISTIVSVLIDNLPLILDAGVDILMELISGIGSVLGDLVTKIGEVASTILDGLGDIVSDMFDIGSNIVSGIWDGINDGYEWIKGKISEWVGNVVSFFKKILGISSPSKVMRDSIGQWLPEGIAAGFEKEMPESLKKMQSSLDEAIGDLKTDVAVQANGMFDGAFGGDGSTGIGGRSQVINFNQYNNSPKAIDRLTLYRETNSLLFSAKVRLANV